MELKPGEIKCNKCNGSGKYCTSHVHSLPEHNHSNPHNHNLSSYAAESICAKCNGAGKVDWITNAMGEQPNRFITSGSHNHGNLAGLNPSENVTFHISGSTVLEINKDGFYVEGRKITDDKEVYDRFNKFLVGAGY